MSTFTFSQGRFTACQNFKLGFMVVSMFFIILIGFHDFQDSFMEFRVFFAGFRGFLVFLVGCSWLSIGFYA